MPKHLTTHYSKYSRLFVITIITLSTTLEGCLSLLHPSQKPVLLAGLFSCFQTLQFLKPLTCTTVHVAYGVFKRQNWSELFLCRLTVLQSRPQDSEVCLGLPYLLWCWGSFVLIFLTDSESCWALLEHPTSSAEAALFRTVISCLLLPVVI